MVKNIKNKFKKNFEIFGLVAIIIVTVILTSFYNYKKNLKNNTFNSFIDNIYFKKTLNYIVENLDPKYKKIKHKVTSGETFDKILENYEIEKEEIIKIKKSLNKKINLNKLKTKQLILFTINKTNNNIEEFIYQISNTQKIVLKRDNENDKFNNQILSIKLNKESIYKENTIIQSLYNAATNENIPPNIIVEFARIYGFQVDFQRDIRKKDKFQILYEVF